VDQNVLVAEQLEAGAEFVRRFNEYAPVDVAFWVKPVASERWSLYIASSELTEDRRRDAIEELVRLDVAHRNQWLDVFHVRLLNSADPLAVGMAEFRDYRAVTTPMPYDGSWLGGMAFDGAYVYPPIAAPTSAT
jgi:hypothetical protein